MWIAIGIVIWVLITISVSFVVTNIMTSRMKDLEYSKLRAYCQDIAQVNLGLFQRYAEILESHFKWSDDDIASLSAVKELCYLAIANINEMPPDKQSRWIGYVQKTLLDKNMIRLDEERLFTRHLYHEVYRKYNMSLKVLDTSERPDVLIKND